jgi:hypothetical protein
MARYFIMGGPDVLCFRWEVMNRPPCRVLLTHAHRQELGIGGFILQHLR